jgi:hypothetical protein
MKNHKVIISLFCLSVIILIFFPKWTVDDSAILWRYADNFKQGFGLVWNAGQYLQSYTGITLLTFLIISPFPYIITSYIIGVVSFLIGGYILYLIVKDSPAKNLLLICYFLNAAIYVHVFAGLETILFSTLLLTSFYFYREKKKWYLLISLIIATLTRPEAFILSIILFSTKKDYKILFYYLLVIGIFLLMTSMYYGDIFPNSFYRKSWNSDKFDANWTDFKQFFSIYMLVPLTYLVIILFKKQIQKIDWKASLFIVLCIVYYLHANLEMNYSGRFFFHVYPLFLAVIGTVTFKKAKKK